MSTYLNMNNPKRRKNDFSDCPEILKEYLYYSETIRSLSARSVNGYYIDLRTFFRFLKRHKRLVSDDLEFDKIPFSDVDITFVKQITKSDVYEYLQSMSGTILKQHLRGKCRVSRVFSNIVRSNGIIFWMIRARVLKFQHRLNGCRSICHLRNPKNCFQVFSRISLRGIIAC